MVPARSLHLLQTADLRLRLANLYRETGDLEAAAYELDEALKVKPLYVPAQIALFGAAGDRPGERPDWQMRPKTAFGWTAAIREW